MHLGEGDRGQGARAILDGADALGRPAHLRSALARSSWLTRPAPSELAIAVSKAAARAGSSTPRAMASALFTTGCAEPGPSAEASDAARRMRQATSERSSTISRAASAAWASASPATDLRPTVVSASATRVRQVTRAEKSPTLPAASRADAAVSSAGASCPRPWCANASSQSAGAEYDGATMRWVTVLAGPRSSPAVPHEFTGNHCDRPVARSAGQRCSPAPITPRQYRQRRRRKGRTTIPKRVPGLGEARRRPKSGRPADAVEALGLFEFRHGSEVVPQALPKPFLPVRVEGVIQESWQILCLHKESRVSGDEVVRGLLVPAGGAAAFGPGMDAVNVLADDFGTEMIVVLDQPPKRAMREDEYGAFAFAVAIGSWLWPDAPPERRPKH